MKIGAREIGNGQPCYIIAEAGTGYVSGDPNVPMFKAFRLAETAKMAGADAVKFQIFAPDEPLFCPLPGDEKRWARWRRGMNLACWEVVKQRCNDLGIAFLASAFQPSVVNWLKKIDVAAYKVASRAAATYPYDAVPGPFIVSEGLGAAPDALLDGKEHIRLQCVSKYPSWRLWQQPNFGAAWCMDCDYGLSDHSGSVWPGIHAITHGAPMLEVHFAIDKADAGNDAPVCLTTDQLKLLCEARDAFAALRQN